MAIYNRDPVTGILSNLSGENIDNIVASSTRESAGTTSTKPHSEGDYFDLDGVFVKAIDDILTGDTLEEGVNYEKTNVANELENLNEEVGTASTAYTNSTRALNMIRSTSSDVYSTSKAYNVGDYCIYNNTLYKCTTACSAGSWTTNKTCFTIDTLTNAVTTLNNDLSNVAYISEDRNSVAVTTKDGDCYISSQLVCGLSNLHLSTTPAQVLATWTGSFAWITVESVSNTQIVYRLIRSSFNTISGKANFVIVKS